LALNFTTSSIATLSIQISFFSRMAISSQSTRLQVNIILRVLVAMDLVVRQLTIFHVSAYGQISLEANSVLIEVGKSRLCVRGVAVPSGGVRGDKYLYWSNPPSSGLGDRMINLLAAQTIAWYECKTLLLIWPPSSKAGTFPPYRRLFEVTPGLVVLDKKKGDMKKGRLNIPKGARPEHLSILPGWGYPKSVIYNMRRRLLRRRGRVTHKELLNKEYFNLEQVVRVYIALAHQLRPKPPISRLIRSYIPTVQGAVGLHIRRGDKTIGERYSRTMQGISREMLTTLDKTTPQVLEEILNFFPGVTVFIASDSTSEKQRYTKFVSERGGSAIIFREYGHSRNKEWMPFNIGMEEALGDILLLAQCSVILQSTSMSSFSALGAAMGSGKLINLLPTPSKCQSQSCHRFSDTITGFITPWENRTTMLMSLEGVRYEERDAFLSHNM